MEVKKFAKTHGLKVEDRRITYDRGWQDVAKGIMDEFNVVLPFIVHGEKVIGFNDSLADLLVNESAENKDV